MSGSAPHFRPDLPKDCREAAHQLNRECACLSVDHAALRIALESGGLDYDDLGRTRPHLFSDTVVFAGEASLRRMGEIVAAIESVVALPAYQEQVLAWAPEIARRPVAARGVFLGYDFHIDPQGPHLIEINTNAGGGLLNSRLARAQRACCGPVATMLPNRPGAVEDDFVAMFREEWRLSRGAAPLKRIAIVDEDPGEQYLAPEFELFRQVFEAAGIAAVIADPRELAWDGGRLTCRGEVVDLVYNRLTDFSFESKSSAPLRAAYEADGAVITPHPRAHALYADKRNLMLLSDEARLIEMGVPEATRQVLLAGIPSTVAVQAEDGERFWQERRRWFFKPAAGFGSRATYRGDKLTKRVFEEILQGGYIAQEIVPPSERRIHVAAEPRDLKLDLRCYVYAGEVQLVAARLYQGQTTNFRTPGGGFASVLAVPSQGRVAA
ncbi:MAG TPA: hypothetical protein VJ576_14785 [Rhodocyclaceae bacterium]|nr:hypothetical protein [Rhodocyclaceae bacterium]